MIKGFVATLRCYFMARC